MMFKACKKCKEVKTIDGFYIHQHTKDKRRSSCISCWKKDNRKTPEENKAYRSANIDRLRKYDRERRNSAFARKEKSVSDKIWRKNTIEEIRSYELKRKFGIGSDDYEAMLIRQNSLCGICGKEASGKRKRLAVDHNHKNGKIRGLLCHRCNTAIGLLNEDKSLFNSAIKYLGLNAI